MNDHVNQESRLVRGLRFGARRIRIRSGLALTVVLAALILAGSLWKCRRPTTWSISELHVPSSSAPAVAVLTVQFPSGAREFVLPASVEPKTEAAIYSRATGYLKRRLVDVGDQVTAGQVLAEVETPELGHQIEQAESQLMEMKAGLLESRAVVRQKQALLELSQATGERSLQLAKEGLISRQAADEQYYTLLSRVADFGASQASARRAESQIASVQARLNELRELKSFERIRAPFDGVITSRKADVGSLLIPGTGPGEQELFHLVKNGSTRILAQIPQDEARFLNPGSPCEIDLENPDHTTLTARIIRSSQDLDPTTRTLLVEIAPVTKHPNLIPGMYVQARFLISSSSGAGMLIPASALMLHAGRTDVAVLDAANFVHFRQVTVGRDEGTSVEIIGGLKPGERIVLSISDAVRDGLPVRIIPQ